MLCPKCGYDRIDETDVGEGITSYMCLSPKCTNYTWLDNPWREAWEELLSLAKDLADKEEPVAAMYMRGVVKAMGEIAKKYGIEEMR